MDCILLETFVKNEKRQDIKAKTISFGSNVEERKRIFSKELPWGEE
jgi:hypothetical protein